MLPKTHEAESSCLKTKQRPSRPSPHLPARLVRGAEESSLTLLCYPTSIDYLDLQSQAALQCSSAQPPSLSSVALPSLAAFALSYTMSPYPTPSPLSSRLRACLYRSSFPLPSLVIHHRSFASQSPSSDSAPVPSPSPDSGFGLRAEPRSSSSKQKSSRKNQGYGLASKSSESNLSSSSPSSTRSTSLSSSSGSTSSNRPSKNSSSKRNSSSPSPLSSSYPSSAASFVRPPSSHPSQPRPKSYLPHSTVSPSPSPTTAFTHSSYHTLDGLPRPEVIYAVSHEEANEALGRLQGPVLALDVEWNSGMQEGEKLSPTAVIQVGDGMFCVVVSATGLSVWTKMAGSVVEDVVQRRVDSKDGQG
jgi:hypothetical protein